MKEIINIINLHDEFNRLCDELELKLKQRYPELLKVMVMCKSLDVYLTFDDRFEDVDGLCDFMGCKYGGYFVMERNRITYRLVLK